MKENEYLSVKYERGDSRNAHHPRSDPLVKSPRPLLLEHIPRNTHNPAHRGLARLSGRPLKARLDGIDGSIRERAHRTADQPDQHSLIARQLLVCIRRLRALQQRLELRVSGEVDCLISPLAERGQGDAAVEGAWPFFAENGEQAVYGIAVFGHVERVGEAVILGL